MEERMGGVKSKALWGGIGTLVVFILIIIGLYLLGGSDQSALERLRDISVIFVVLLSMIVVVLLAAITVALVFLVFQIKDNVIPLLEEATGTVKRIRGTTNFVTEEAVKPIVTAAGTYSRIRGMTKVVVGKTKKPPKVGDV
ncbi:MAG TPA: hypothetical protein VNZ55_01250 [Thermomicrobiales bacterium]|nr:hypothetical protein [Thermomicrobiales bacterium]